MKQRSWDILGRLLVSSFFASVVTGLTLSVFVNLQTSVFMIRRILEGAVIGGIFGPLLAAMPIMFLAWPVCVYYSDKKAGFVKHVVVALIISIPLQAFIMIRTTDEYSGSGFWIVNLIFPLTAVITAIIYWVLKKKAEEKGEALEEREIGV